MAVSFYIIKNKSNSSSIYCSINYQGINRLVYQLPNSKININSWGKGGLKKGKGLLNDSVLKKLKERMETFSKDCDTFYLEFNNINRQNPTKEEFLLFFKSMKEPQEYFSNQKVFDLIPYFKNLIEIRKSGLYLKRGGTRYGKGTIAGYETTLDLIKEYLETKKIKFTNLSASTKEFILGFEHFLTITKEFKLNYVSNRKKILKSFLEVFYQDGLISVNPFKRYNIPVQWERGVGIALDEEEMEEMFNLDLTSFPHLDEVRDQFMVLAWTGLRVSDYSDFKQVNKNGNVISLYNQKTNKQVNLPLFPKLEQVLIKYNWTLPKLRSEQKMRVHLKTIGKMVSGLNREIQIQFTKGGVTQRKFVKRYTHMSLHVGRRTMCSYLSKIGVSNSDILFISGHASVRDLEVYIRPNHSEVLQNMIQKVIVRESETKKDNIDKSGQLIC